MIRVLILLVFVFVFDLNASSLSINNGTGIDINGDTIIDCTGIGINYAQTNQCCIGNSCSDINQISLLNPSGFCPSIVFDGLLYQVDSNIRIIHNVKILSVDQGSMTSCRKPDNSFPTTGGFEQFNLDFNNVFAGIQSMSLDVDTWQLRITSIDGNLVCQGGLNVDLIFKNSFEQE